jgi:ribose 5-phosphate isomerase A
VGVEDDKRVAAEAAADLVRDGMRLGLGTGTTAAYLLEALGRRRPEVRCVATSPRTEEAARGVGLHVEPFDQLERLDLAIDGADQVAGDGWLVKGGGGAHTREKVVAASADAFVVIVDATKLVDRVHGPVPLELLAFGLPATLERLGSVALRDAPSTPDGGLLADYRGEVDDAAQLAARLSLTPGVVEHGLFPPTLVTTVLVGRDGAVASVGGGLT